MKNPNIVVIGSLNMDLVHSMERMPKQGETVHAKNIQYIPGGKGANQAVGCVRLGADTRMLGAIGVDPFGERILQDLREYSIPIEHILCLESVPTGTATIFHTLEDNCIAIVAGANGKVTPEYIYQHKDMIERADVVLLQLEIPLGTVKAALQLARSAGVKTVLNPAPALILEEELIKLADVITPNESEFEILADCRIGESEQLLTEAMFPWESKYANKLVITRGQQGVSHLQNGQLHTIAAPQVKVVDTTGAGDCFNAALSYGLALGWDWSRILTFAVRAASLSVTKFGAQAGMPTIDQFNH